MRAIADGLRKKTAPKNKDYHIHATAVPPLTGQEDRRIVALQRDSTYLMAYE